MKIPAVASAPLANRIRVMASLDRTKGHSRQEGSFRARVNGAEVVFKVQMELRPDGMDEAMIQCPQS